MQQWLNGQYSLKALAETVGGEVRGDGEFVITGLANLESAGPNDLSFVARNKLRNEGARSKAGALLVSAAIADQMTTHCIVVADPYRAYAQISQLFWQTQMLPDGVEPSAVIAPDVSLPVSTRIGPHVVIESGARLGEGVEIAAGCYIGADVVIGDRTHLRPRVTLYPGTTVGEDCLLHAGVVLGSDGFGFAPTEGGWEKIAQLGRVIIGDRVEIGANSTIDRGALEDTVIGDDVIIDNLVQIGHNAELGAGSAMAGQSGLAGSAKVGRRVMVGGQAGVGGHITIADGVQFHGQAMVNKSIPDAGAYASGIPVQPAGEWRKMVARLKQLTELNTRVATLWQAHKAAMDGQAPTEGKNERADPDDRQHKD